MSVAATAIGRAAAPASPAGTRAGRVPGPGLLAFFALALLAALRFAALLTHPPTLRVLGIVLVAGSAGAALALTAALPGSRGLARSCRIALLLAGSYLSLRLAGVPSELLMPWHWPALARRLAHGLQELNGLWPYTGESRRARLVVVAALAGALMGAAALVFWPAAGAARRRRAGALAILLGVYLTAVVNQPRAGWQLQGLMLLALLSLWGWAWWPRMHERGRALAWLAVAAVLALLLSGFMQRSGALIDFHDWNPFGRVYPAQSFDWNQTYGPRVWPNTSEAMVEVSAGAPRLWRASTLDRFDGVRFLRSSAPPARTSGLPAGKLQARWLERATFTVRGLSSAQLLSPGVALALSSASPELRRRARLASDGTVALSGEAPPSGARYTVSAYVPQPSAAAMGAAPQRTPAAYAPYAELELPGRAGAARSIDAQSAAGAARIASSPYAGVLALAHRLAAGAGSNYEVARRIESYLRSGGYVYDERPPNRRYPLASFLLEDRRGYCQQFSGAMALLLRMDGIPARVAAGFLAGSRERAGGRFLLTAQDAHAWVEVYFAGIGWVAFDPTPAAAGAGGRGAALEHLALQTPAGAAAARAGVTHRGRRRIGGAAKPRRAAAHSGSGTALAAALVAALGLALLAAWWLARALRMRERAARASGSVAELARALASLGVELGDDTTLAELERRLQRSHGSQAAGYVRLLRERRYAPAADPRRPDDRDRRLLRRALCAGRGPLARLRALRALPPGMPSPARARAADVKRDT